MASTSPMPKLLLLATLPAASYAQAEFIDDLGTEAFIAVAVGAVVVLACLAVLLVCFCRCLCGSREDLDEADLHHMRVLQGKGKPVTEADIATETNLLELEEQGSPPPTSQSSPQAQRNPPAKNNRVSILEDDDSNVDGVSDLTSTMNKSNLEKASQLKASANDAVGKVAISNTAAKRRERGLSYGRIDKAAQERIQSVRLQAAQMNMLPFKPVFLEDEDEEEQKPAPAQKPEKQSKKSKKQQKKNKKGPATLPPTLAQPNKKKRFYSIRMSSSPTKEAKGTKSSTFEDMPMMPQATNGRISGKALKLLGATEEEVKQPFTEPVKKRIERIARGAGGGVYNTGLSTARLSTQIVEGFQLLREKKEVQKQTMMMDQRTMKATEDANRARRLRQSQAIAQQKQDPTQPKLPPGKAKLQAFLSSTKAETAEEKTAPDGLLSEAEVENLI